MRRFAIWLVLFLGLVCIAPRRSMPAAEASTAKREKDMTGWKWANFAILAVALGYLAREAGRTLLRVTLRRDPQGN